MPIPLRAAFDATQVRAAARQSRDTRQAWRLLALAAIYDGASRTAATRIDGVIPMLGISDSYPYPVMAGGPPTRPSVAARRYDRWPTVNNGSQLMRGGITLHIARDSAARSMLRALTDRSIARRPANRLG
jgi:hypothetical protein